MNLYEAKEYLNTKGYILEDTETQDDEYSELHRKYDDAVRDTLPNADTLLRRKTKLYHKHLDLDNKINYASNFNIKNLFNGVEKALKTTFKKVNKDTFDYDEESASQLVRFFIKYKTISYCLEVMYYDEDGVVKLQIFDEDSIGAETDEFNVKTIDKAIEQIMNFVNFQVRGI